MTSAKKAGTAALWKAPSAMGNVGATAYGVALAASRAAVAANRASVCAHRIPLDKQR
ncbi:hypothetical protein [Carnimonas bestiolae]|uniref:hypothetical protein n=1 Tax=Carnimonas bestiolae TaxID=3402172 RepID=UPI003F4AB39A